MCVCVCACVRAWVYAHAHTHTHIHSKLHMCLPYSFIKRSIHSSVSNNSLLPFPLHLLSFRGGKLRTRSYWLILKCQKITPKHWNILCTQRDFTCRPKHVADTASWPQRLIHPHLASLNYIHLSAHTHSHTDWQILIYKLSSACCNPGLQGQSELQSHQNKHQCENTQ